MADVLMPRLSDGMEEGTVVKWLIADGASVAVGDELVEIETEKATVAHVSEVEGILETLVPEGSSCAVDSVIARISTSPAPAKESVPGTSITSDAPDTSPDGSHSAPPPEPPVAPAAIVEQETAPAADQPAIAGTGPTPADLTALTALTTPLSRKAAERHGVDVGTVRGTGPRGRVLIHDVLAVAGLHVTGPAARPRSVPGANGQTPVRQFTEAGATGVTTGDVSLVPLTAVQRVIARRMTESTSTIPHFQIGCIATMDALLALRRQLREAAGSQPVPTLNDLIVKACALALRRHPLANGSYTPEGIEFHQRVNVGFAVATDDALVVPTVFDADTRSVGSISSVTSELAGKVRAGNVSPSELEGGTFTVSNLGMYGVSSMVPIINPPQAAILGVGALRDELTRSDGRVVDRTVATLTLSCDHRILYGSHAALFLGEIKQLLETPIQLVL